MYKKIIFTILCLLGFTSNMQAQENTGTPVGTTVVAQGTASTQSNQSAQQIAIRYGKIQYNAILVSMPEYQAAKERMGKLRKKYEDEATYNESSFKRMFAEFLQGQKDFPQNIMLKRQRDLQDAMEKGIAFRQEADSLLRQAEIDLLKPIRERLDQAIYLVGAQRGYECIFNTDSNTVPFLHPMITEDATPFVLEKLNEKK